jgi:Flp pilus assembly protein TadD
MSGVTSIYPTRSEQITALDKLEDKLPFTGWLSLKANSIRLREESTKSKALQALLALTESAATPDKVKAATWSLLGSESYGAGNFEEARTRFKRGVELDSDNPELCNNYAYILSVKLGKCEEAMPFTLKAARSDSQNSGYLDTLGATLLCNQKWDEAVQTLNQALNVAKNDAERIPVYIHLGRAQTVKKVPDRNEARRLANQARDLMSTLPTVRAQYDADLKDLERAIDSK